MILLVISLIFFFAAMLLGLNSITRSKEEQYSVIKAEYEREEEERTKVVLLLSAILADLMLLFSVSPLFIYHAMVEPLGTITLALLLGYTLLSFYYACVILDLALATPQRRVDKLASEIEKSNTSAFTRAVETVEPWVLLSVRLYFILTIFFIIFS